MKKGFLYFTAFFILVGFLFFQLPAEAHFIEGSSEAIKAEQAAARLPEPGLLPDSFFYFYKIFKEKIQAFFVFRQASKTDFNMNIANKRMSELLSLVHKNQQTYLKNTLDGYGRTLLKVSDLMVKVQGTATDASALEERHKNLLDDHEMILLNVKDDIPQDAEAVYRHALDVIDQSRDHMQYESAHGDGAGASMGENKLQKESAEHKEGEVDEHVAH